MHLSDCGVHDGQECDCGGLELAPYVSHRFVATHIPSTGSFGFFVQDRGRECFIEAHDLPPLALAAVASAADLPDAHDAIAILGTANSVDFDHAKETIVAKLKALTPTEGVTSRCFPHADPHGEHALA